VIHPTGAFHDAALLVVVEHLHRSPQGRPARLTKKGSSATQNGRSF
jgi:hypothetical protein